MSLTLHIASSGLSGIASVCFSIIEGDLDPGSRHCIGFYGVEPMPPPYHEQCQALDIEYVAIQKKRGVDLRSLRALYHWIETQSPDAILVHVPRTLDAALWYRRKHPETRVVGVEHHPNTLKTGIEWLFSARFARQCDAVVYLGHYYEQDVARKLGRWYRPRRVSIIPNGINTNQFSPAAPGTAAPDSAVAAVVSAASSHTDPDGSPVRFGMGTRLSNQKDIPTLLAAVALLCEERDLSRPPIRLLLAGDGPQREEYEALTRTLGIQESVQFTGFLGEEVLIDFLRSLDFYVQATLNETMSTSVMQGLAVGLPVIASAIPGMDALVDEEVGALVPPQDPGALAAALRTLIKSPEQRATLAKAARQRALARFSHEHCATAYKELLRTL